MTVRSPYKRFSFYRLAFVLKPVGHSLEFPVFFLSGPVRDGLSVHLHIHLSSQCNTVFSAWMRLCVVQFNERNELVGRYAFTRVRYRECLH